MNDEEILTELVALIGGNLLFVNNMHVCCADILDALNSDIIRYFPDKNAVALGSRDHSGYYFMNYCPFCGEHLEAK
jgi:hypothetical protein